MFPIWNFFIEKRQFTMMVLVGLSLWGLIAAQVITKESSPEVQIPIGVVSVAYPGASAEDVERLITNKIEEQLINLGELNTLTSSSREGVAVITAEFNASANIEKSIQKLKDEVDKVRPDLPEDATDPSVTDVNFVDQPVQIISVTTDAPFIELANLADDLKSDLQSIKGVSRIEISGVRNREIQVIVRKEDLARYNIALPQVISALQSSNASLPVGTITTDNVDYNIAFRGGLDQVRDLEGLAVLNAGGRVIYLRDIAAVADGVEEARSYTRISTNGTPSEQALTLLVFKVRGADVTTVTAAVRDHIDELEQNVLAGSQVVITNDAGEQVVKDLSGLTQTGLQTVALVMLVLFLTIGWRESLIAGLAIPLSFLIAFIGLLYSGNTINFVSLFSLILAIGILVDSGIVMVEAIHTRIHHTETRREAARQALREYAWPLIGGTMTTVAVFVPLFFISGIVGKFIATIPFTVIFVLLASIFVALALVPTLTIILTPRSGSTSKLSVLQERYTAQTQAWYQGWMEWLFANRRYQNRFFAGLAVAFFAVFIFPISGLMGVTFFPQGDIDFMYVDIELPAGTPLNQTDLIARLVEEQLYQNPDIESLVTSVGGTSSFGNSPQNGSQFATLTINLPTNREKTSSQILQEIEATLAPFAVADIRVGQPSGGPPVGAPIVIKVLGTDRDDLATAAEMVRQTLTETPGASGVTQSNENDGIEYTLDIDRAKLAQAGITPAQLASTLRTAVSGVTATKLIGGERDVDVVVSLNLNTGFIDPHEASHTSLDTLRYVPITNSQGDQILVGSLITQGIRQSTASIAHEGRKRVMSVTSTIDPDTTAQEVITQFNAQFDRNTLPTGIEVAVGGENEETDESFKEMGYAFVGGLALMFIILVLSFNSYKYAGFILLTVPLSLIGVFIGLTVSGQPLSFPSLLGVIALSGVVINNAIILVDSTINLVRKNPLRERAAMIIEAATTRLRPILLTTITTVIGMIPLVFASELWAPLALAILFGLSFAVVLTLILVPLLLYRYPSRIEE